MTDLIPPTTQETRLVVETREGDQVLPPLMPDTQAETDWRDPWAATKPAREHALRPGSRMRDQFLADLDKVSQIITDEINKDPDEVLRLRKARMDARNAMGLAGSGTSEPLRRGTKSSRAPKQKTT